jgi:hypothetical protein
MIRILRSRWTTSSIFNRETGAMLAIFTLKIMQSALDVVKYMRKRLWKNPRSGFPSEFIKKQCTAPRNGLLQLFLNLRMVQWHSYVLLERSTCCASDLLESNGINESSAADGAYRWLICIFNAS